MCSWCWGFRSTWHKLKQALPQQVKVVSRVGGLAPDSDVPMADTLQQSLQSTWHRIQQQIPGTEFNFDFWDLNVPRRSTYPACRAVIAARQLADSEEEMTYGIQQAYYVQAKNPSDVDTLVDVAQGIGMDAQAFRKKLLSDDISQALNDELDEVRGLGIDSFPSLLICQDSRQEVVPLNYNSADSMLHDINRFLGSRNH
jgi:putative protein-disulfide isomerase